MLWMDCDLSVYLCCFVVVEYVWYELVFEVV